MKIQVKIFASFLLLLLVENFLIKFYYIYMRHKEHWFEGKSEQIILKNIKKMCNISI